MTTSLQDSTVALSAYYGSKWCCYDAPFEGQRGKFVLHQQATQRLIHAAFYTNKSKRQKSVRRKVRGVMFEKQKGKKIPHQMSLIAHNHSHKSEIGGSQRVMV